jgi:HAD superfamily phosphatase (TIGR01668 family)
LDSCDFCNFAIQKSWINTLGLKYFKIILFLPFKISRGKNLEKLFVVTERLSIIPMALHMLASIFKQNASQSRVYSFPNKIDSLAMISLNCLCESRIRGIILDLDNTIISEDDRYISPGAESWLKQAKLVGLKCFLLSNGKRHYRVQYWSNRLALPAISPANKPFPTAFRNAMKYMQLSPKQVIVIGDSRHTDILGAWLAGCPSIQVASLPHPPRWWERLFGRYLQSPFPEDHDLWEF